MTELKRNEVLSFDDGLLTVKMSGHGVGNGWATLSFNEKQFELDDEGYQVLEIPPSELFELRDFLNRVLPAKRRGDPTPADTSASMVGGVALSDSPLPWTFDEGNGAGPDEKESLPCIADANGNVIMQIFLDDPYQSPRVAEK